MGRTLRTIPTGGRDTPDTGMGTAGATGRRQQLLIWAGGPHMKWRRYRGCPIHAVSPHEWAFGGWPTSRSKPQNRVPHISILRCGHSRKARTVLLQQSKDRKVRQYLQDRGISRTSSKLVRSCGTRYPGGKAGVLLILPPRRANRLSHALQMPVDHFPRNSYILYRASNQLFFLYSNHGKTLIQARSRNRVAE